MKPSWIETTKIRKNLKKLMQKFVGKRLLDWKCEQKRNEIKQKQEKKREKREGKEEVEEKSENILSIVISKNCVKTRRELNGAMPYRYRPILINN